MIRDSVKGLLTYKGYMLKDYADALNIQPISLTKKLQTNSFSLKDLYVLADMTNTELRLVDKDKSDTFSSVPL